MRIISSLALLLVLTVSGAPAKAQSSATINPSPDSSAPHSWTDQQILTCTVAQCWLLAGKDEAKFFDIVQQLAAISAENRQITLPNDAAAGQKVGNYIKTKAKADHEALLFGLVDSSVRYVGRKEQAASATK